MIWFNLALFFVSFIITALLAPKPNIENARADELNPESFPRATENAPIPLILGKVRMEAPNTIWYGGFRSVPIKERVRVSPFKKKTIVVGHQYYLTLHLALATGPQTVMTKIFMDDKEIWTGSTSPNSPTNVDISASSLFGGHKEGGGFSVSGATYYPGSLLLSEQPVNAHMESQLGVGNVPAYLGTAHIVLPDAYIGESAQLRKIAFMLENYSNSLGLPNNGKIGEDMNPAEAIYQIMTNSWRGMGIAPTEINIPMLTALGNRLYTEGNGVSVAVTAESSGRQVIQEILRQIDAIAYQDPETGEVIYELIRDDYDIDTIPHFDEDEIIAITNFSRSGWEEVVAQVKISFPQRDKESDAVAISQDMATVAMLGRLRSSTLSMPFCYDPETANRIASRERAQLSVPLFQMTIEMNRRGHGLRPGSVFSLSWAQYRFSRIIMRVQSFDLGSLISGKIIINCIQDKFSLSDTVFASPGGSIWVPPVAEPININDFDVIELPKVISNILEYPPADGAVAVMPLAARPQSTSNAFDMICGQVTGVLDNVDPEYVDYLGSGVLVNSYSRDEGFSTGNDTTVGMTVIVGGGAIFTAGNTTAQIRAMEQGLLYVNGEWMSYTSAMSLGGGQWKLDNIRRGLLGTMPLTHAAGTRVYEIDSDFFPSGQIEDIVEGSTIFYKLIDRVGRKSQNADSLVQRSKLLNQTIANRPLRPTYLTIGGNRTGINITTKVAQNLTWRPRNRMRTEAVFENDNPETPDQAETYNIDVLINGVRNATLSASGVTGTTYSIPFNLTGITEANCEVRVWSSRTSGGRVSLTYAHLPFSMAQPP